MTPTDEATFIRLWQEGARYKAIARALSCPLGTVAFRLAALAAQGNIQPRQRGRVSPNRRAKARQDITPPPVQSSAAQDSAEQSGAGYSRRPSLVPSPAVASAAIIDLLRQTLARLDTVEQDLKAIREDHHSPPVQGRAEQCRAVQTSIP